MYIIDSGAAVRLFCGTDQMTAPDDAFRACNQNELEDDVYWNLRVATPEAVVCFVNRKTRVPASSIA